MKRRWVIRLVLAALVFWLAWRAWRLVEGDPILTLMFFIVGGVIAAFVIVKVVLARVADAIGNAVFLSGGPQTPEDTEKTEGEALDEAVTETGEKVPDQKADAP
jgi:type VI protein secretion system component VasK